MGDGDQKDVFRLCVNGNRGNLEELRKTLASREEWGPSLNNKCLLISQFCWLQNNNH